uniref:ABC transporter permease n=1 Tax=Roseihalotalea indica TaxID=2867963 RepID=A0AA49JG48_9BACT|nr:ABC transporter permease [Tunicatimonas sp. TK19036]
MNPLPPKKALHFLRWFCREDYLEEIEGNLLEIYEQQHRESPAKAKRQFTWNVLRHFRLAFIKSFSFHSQTSSGMLHNYFKIAWRSMLKQKLYATVNISGLSVGLSCFLLIFLYVQHELSYDRFFSNADRIYRVYQRQAGNEYMGSDYFGVTPAGLARALEDEVPEVVQATTLEGHSALLGEEDNYYFERGLLTDTHFFEVLPYELVEGNPQTALSDPQNIILTESLARKIFGSTDAIGKQLTVNKEQLYASADRMGQYLTVTGIVADPPTNSTIQFTYLASIQSNSRYVKEREMTSWDSNNYYTFFTLADNATPQGLDEKLSDIHQKYVDYGENFPFEGSYHSQSLNELHLETRPNFDIGTKGNTRYIQLFSLIAGMVLLLACINYVNLALARSIKRAAEVGLRKVVGARRIQLISQFIGESVFIAGIALGLALVLCHLLLPVFNRFFERTLELNLLANTWLLPSLVGLVVVVGVLSGAYPAFRMASLRPVQVLKGSVSRKSSKISFQHWLMIGQYTVSIVLIIGSIVIYRQFQFIRNKELGFDKDYIVTIPVQNASLSNQYENLKQEWLAYPKVVSATGSSSLPTNISSQTILTDDAITDEELIIYQSWVDYDYLKVFGMELVAGRIFSRDYPTDAEEACIFNEAAVRALGWTPEEAIGKQFVRDSVETIIGVVKDFHMHSLHSSIAPLMLQLRTGFSSYFSIKVRPENLSETLSFVEASIKPHTPFPYEYQFLDERFDQLYQSDQRLGEIFGFFTVLSILVASLGLFGMAAFTAGQRTKEIGIRKVLGASVGSIIQLLSQDFIKLVFVGFVVAVPLAWYVMQQWLADFAYRVELSWWIFGLAGLLALLVAIVTVSSQSYKAALSNPVDSLRNE